jgi:DNA-binding transcriptional regulator YbjK
LSPATDGRRARGEARRQELINAALRLLAREGSSALTHRAIAEEAGVPLASASYHFAGIDDLILTALKQADDELLATFERETQPPTIGGLAELLAVDLRDHRHLYLAYYEFYLRAARKPELRAAATAWLDLVTDHYAPHLNPAERRVFQATIEGLSLHATVHGYAPSADELREALTLVWRAAQAGSPCGPKPA